MSACSGTCQPNSATSRFVGFIPPSAGIHRPAAAALGGLLIEWPICRPFMQPGGRLAFHPDLSASEGFAYMPSCRHLMQPRRPTPRHTNMTGRRPPRMHLCPLCMHLWRHLAVYTTTWGAYSACRHVGLEEGCTRCRIVAPVLATHKQSHDIGIAHACRANGF